MAKTSAIPVRFEESAMARLERLAVASKMSVAELIRRAAESYMDEVEKRGSIVIDVRDRLRVVGDANLNEDSPKYRKSKK